MWESYTKIKNIYKEDNMTISSSGSEEETANEDFDFWLHHKQLAVGQKRRPLEEWVDLSHIPSII